MKYQYHKPYFQLSSVSSGDEGDPDTDLLFANEPCVPNRPIRTGKKVPRRFRLSIGESTPILDTTTPMMQPNTPTLQPNSPLHQLVTMQQQMTPLQPNALTQPDAVPTPMMQPNTPSLQPNSPLHQLGTMQQQMTPLQPNALTQPDAVPTPMMQPNTPSLQPNSPLHQLGTMQQQMTPLQPHAVTQPDAVPAQSVTPSVQQSAAPHQHTATPYVFQPAADESDKEKVDNDFVGTVLDEALALNRSIRSKITSIFNCVVCLECPRGDLVFCDQCSRYLGCYACLIGLTTCPICRGALYCKPCRLPGLQELLE